MKKLLNTFCVLLAFVISIGVEALADNQVSNRIYAILSTVLSDPATHTELFSDNTLIKVSFLKSKPRVSLFPMTSAIRALCIPMMLP